MNLFKCLLKHFPYLTLAASPSRGGIAAQQRHLVSINHAGRGHAATSHDLLEIHLRRALKCNTSALHCCTSLLSLPKSSGAYHKTALQPIPSSSAHRSRAEAAPTEGCPAETRGDEVDVLM